MPPEKVLMSRGKVHIEDVPLSVIFFSFVKYHPVDTITEKNNFFDDSKKKNRYF